MSVIIEDRTEKLTLFHYQRVDENSTSDIKQSRGRITNDKDEVVCSSFSYTPEYVVKEQREKYESSLKDLSACTIYSSEEGTLLRLFFDNNRWHLSTHKRINAFESRWSSTTTFGEWFMEALHYFFTDGAGKNTLQFENKDSLFDRFCSTLDTSVVYTYLLRTNAETKIVCHPPTTPTVFFGGAFKGDKRVDIDSDIPYPTRLSFESLDALEEFVSQTNPFDHQGVMIILPDDTTMKIIHPKGMMYKRIRGSEPDILCAYLRVRKSKDDVATFTSLFPRFDTKIIEEQLYFMAKYLHSMYVRRYIKKLFTVVHPVLFSVMRAAHTWHVLDRAHNIVTMERMMDLVEAEPYNKLHRLYQEYLTQRNQQQINHPISPSNASQE